MVVLGLSEGLPLKSMRKKVFEKFFPCQDNNYIGTFFYCIGIESLLTTLRSLNEKVGTYEEEEEFKLLESILQSTKFKKAKEV